MERKKQSYWHWAGILGAILVPAIAMAALTIPNSFTAGTVIKSADVNANFTAVANYVNTLETSLSGQVSSLQAQAPIGFARVAGAVVNEVTAFGGVGTTSVTATGNSFPYTVSFTGSYPASITTTKIIVQATAEAGQSGVANATVLFASPTAITVQLWVWNPSTGYQINNNPAFVTLTLGK